MTVAKYLRLSSEDSDLHKGEKLESNSITNQRSLLDDFLSRSTDLSGASVVEFCDDGWSGRNFERPAFQDMIRQIRQGRIQCVVVKDLSRFGRDYLTVGNYISRVFPFLQVRFISVNDGIDSIRPMDVDSLDTSFKTILHDLYCRELSRKVRSAKKRCAERGEFLGPFAPYGYLKDPVRKNRLVIDPPAAEVVRRIFRMAASGKGAFEIAKILNNELIDTPMVYKRNAGCSRTVWPSIGDVNFWTESRIAGLLRDERYTGKGIYGRKKRDEIGKPHLVRVNQEEWIVKENAHDGIITRTEFERAQTALRAYTERCNNIHRRHALCGKIRCGSCGHSMRRSNGKQAFFYCRTPYLTSAYSCHADQTAESEILDAVLQGIHVQALAAVEMKHLWEARQQNSQKNIAGLLDDLDALKTRHQGQNQRIRKLYEEFALGKLDKNEYLGFTEKPLYFCWRVLKNQKNTSWKKCKSHLASR